MADRVWVSWFLGLFGLTHHCGVGSWKWKERVCNPLTWFKKLGNFAQDITVLLLLGHILVSQYNEYKVKKQLIQCHPFNVFSMNKGMFHRKWLYKITFRPFSRKYFKLANIIVSPNKIMQLQLNPYLPFWLPEWSAFTHPKLNTSIW